jgi:2'-5' RNA ligase
MAIGVSAWFDSATESKIRTIWKQLADAGLSRTLHDGPYRPHVTLAVYETIDRASFVPAARQHLSSWRPFPIVFAGLGVFLNDSPTVYLTVTLSNQLHSLHRDVQELLRGRAQGPRAYYLRDAWIPHATLAFALPGPALPKAIDLLRTIVLPLEGTIDRIGVIDTPAEVELETLWLGNGSHDS